MIQGYRGLILSAMAAACLASPAYATVAQKTVHHHPVAHRHVVARRAPVSTPLSDDAFLHAVRAGRGLRRPLLQRHAVAAIESFGPSIFSRWQ